MPPSAHAFACARITPIRANIVGLSCSATKRSACIGGLPYVRIVFCLVFCLGQFGDEERGVATSGFRPGSMIGSKDR